MKIFKSIAIVAIALVAVVAISGFFIDGNYSVEREVTINKPKDQVFAYIKHLKNQDNFSVWAKMDPDMKKEYKGVDGTVGFISSWNSQNKEVGVGEQEIKNIVEGERIDFELRFKVPFEATDNAYMTTTAIDENTTLVKWGFNGKLNYPFNLMLVFQDMAAMLGPSLQDGLVSLKDIQESEPAIAETDSEITDAESQAVSEADDAEQPAEEATTIAHEKAAPVTP